MSVNYRRFLKLLEKWPVDKSKSGRDLGEHLRNQAKLLFIRENKEQLIDKDFDKQLAALERIASDIYDKNYKRILNSTATGLTGEQCNQVLSSEFLEYMNTEKGIFSKK